MRLGSEFDRENHPPTSALIHSEEAVPSGSSTITGGGLDALPRKTGSVTMLQSIPGSSRRMPVAVVLKVYSTSYGRYAVVAQDRAALCKDCGYVKLRHCTVRPLTTCSKPLPSPTPSSVQEPSRGLSERKTNEGVNRLPGFEIISKHGEGESLQFNVRHAAELAEWLAVLAVETEVPSAHRRLRSVSESTVVARSTPDTADRATRRPRSMTSPKSGPLMPCLSEETEQE